MQIVLTSNTVTVITQNVEFIFGDNGGALVELNLKIGQNGNILHTLNHNQTYQGDLTQRLPLQPGSYRCSLLIAAYSGVLGKTYDSFLKIDNKNIANARGIISAEKDPDYDSAIFQLIVS